MLNADGSAFDVTDSSHYWLERLFDQRDQQEGDDVNFTADLNYDLGDGFFSALGAGVQVGTRTAENLVLEQQIVYPRSNQTQLTVRSSSDTPLTLRVRAPRLGGWAALVSTE